MLGGLAGVAAAAAKHDVALVEIAPAYVDVGVRRWQVAADFYTSPAWRALLARIIALRGRRCEDPACARVRAATRVFGDHIVELADGGAPLAIAWHRRPVISAAMIVVPEPENGS